MRSTSIYAISFTLRNKDITKRNEFYDTLRRISFDHEICLDNTWLILSQFSKEDIYKILYKVITYEDQFLVCEININNVSGVIASNSKEFIKKYSLWK